MEIKKNPVLLIQKERPLFTLLGFMVSFTLAFICLSFTFYQPAAPPSPIICFDDDDVYVIPFKPEPEPERPDPEPRAKTDIQIFKPVDHEIKKEPNLKPEIPEKDPTTGIPNVPEKKPEIVIDTLIDVQFADEKPQFKGGEQALHAFLKAQLVYPKAAILYGKEGRVVVQFTVEKDGRITQVRLQNAPLGYDLDQEALRVIKLMPNFIPGRVKKHPVRVICSIPIDFELDDSY